MALTKATFSMIEGASINVLDYGVTGNGITDDTTAIQAAVNAGVAQNKAVYFPNGAYLITTTINLPNNITLYGETQRKINTGGNTYGTFIKTAADITMMQTSSTGDTYGIRIENISFSGNSSTGSALTIGVDSASYLAYGITLRNIDIQFVGNGIKLNGAAYITYLENISMAGTDRAGSYGIWYRRCQIAECHAMKVENFADLYFIQWSSHISLYDCSASFNVPAIANGNNLLKIYGGYHCNFYGCVWENLADSSGSVVEVDIFEYLSDPTKSTHNRFYNCVWNGIGTSACRVRVGSAIGSTTQKTYFENCTFRFWPTVAVDFNFANSNGTVLNQCYSITNYDGADNTLPSTTGTDSGLQIYSINGIQFNGAESTFSPAYTSVSGGGGAGVAYSAQVGNCYKVDKTVTFNIRMILSNKGANVGAVALGNLPFIADGGASDTYPVTIIGTSLNAGVTQPIVGYIIGASQQINLFKYASGGITALQDTDLTNTSSILISGTYIAT